MCPLNSHGDSAEAVFAGLPSTLFDPRDQSVCERMRPFTGHFCAALRAHNPPKFIGKDNARRHGSVSCLAESSFTTARLSERRPAPRCLSAVVFASAQFVYPLFNQLFNQ